jgi:hypothetical protein
LKINKWEENEPCHIAEEVKNNGRKSTTIFKDPMVQILPGVKLG